MAYENIEYRRKEVQDILNIHGKLSMAERKRIAEKYGCSLPCVYIDSIYLLRKSKVSMYMNNTTRAKVYERDGKKCQYCDKETGVFIIEHVIPYIKGGDGQPYNLVIACASCNRNKRSDVWIPKNFDVLLKLNEENANKILQFAVKDFRDCNYF